MTPPARAIPPRSSIPSSPLPRSARALRLEFKRSAVPYVLPLLAAAALPAADGSTYEEAAIRGRDALETYIRFAHEDGRTLPQPRVFAGV